MPSKSPSEKTHEDNVEKLKRLVRNFHEKYKSLGRRVDVGLNFKATATQKARLRERPMRLCPTCRQSPAKNDSYWVADHRPPQALSAGPYTLWPQCCACSAEQSAVVKKSLAGQALTAHEQNLIAVPAAGYQPVSVGGYVTTADRDRVNALGKTHGCITCGGRKNAATVADHFMPAAFNTSFVEKVFKEYKLTRYLKDKYIVEQCWHCSNQQGKEVSAIIGLTKKIAKYLGLPKY